MIPYRPTGKPTGTGLQHVKTVETEAVRKVYFAQSQSEDVLALTFKPRLVEGRVQLCLVGADSLAPSRD